MNASTGSGPREEGDELYALLETLDPADWVRNTPFKSWTVDEGHLHCGDRLAVSSLKESIAGRRRANKSWGAGE